MGAEAYARKLAAEARRFTLVRSELMEGINRILRYVTWAIVPVAVLLLVSQLHARDTVRAALTGTVAALVGMVPQGLVLLTSIAFGVAGFILLFPVPAVRKFYALELPHELGPTLLVAALGTVSLAGLWAVGRRHPAPPGR